MEPITLITGQKIDPATLEPRALSRCAIEVLMRTAELRDILSAGLVSQLMGISYNRLLTLMSQVDKGEMATMALFLEEEVTIAYFGKRYQLLDGGRDNSTGLLPWDVTIPQGGTPLPVQQQTGTLRADNAGPAVAAEQQAPVQYATGSQKEEIIRLLNHGTITRPEKTKMLLNINRLDEERALQAIAKLRKAIEDRSNAPAG